jgi:hypothetical protein
MNVKVEVELRAAPTDVDQDEMHTSAIVLTNNRNSVIAYIPTEKSTTIVAEFTMDKARQVDVVDRIAREFRCNISNYSQSTISFPKVASRPARKAKSKYTQKQGQYLAFIYYYTKLNGRPPAEADMQRYFRTTPPTVHAMVLKLEQLGFIEQVPYQPRSIRLLLPREELPDLG